MDQERRRLLIKIRDYFNNHPTDKINLLQACKAIKCNLSEITRWAPTPSELIKQILELKSKQLSEVLDSEDFKSDSAIDSMVFTGQEIYERFEQLSPAKYLFIKQLEPALYDSSQSQKFELIEKHLNNNLDKGMATGEYKAELNKNDIITKYLNRIKTIHSQEYLRSEHFSFANIFSNIFEDYLEEVATDENWNYFRKRKQFYEAISFINR